MPAGLDGSGAIREPWLTPHSHLNRRKQENANAAGVEVWAARGLAVAGQL